jgi:hypothetical protein
VATGTKEEIYKRQLEQHSRRATSITGCNVFGNRASTSSYVAISMFIAPTTSTELTMKIRGLTYT